MRFPCEACGHPDFVHFFKAFEWSTSGRYLATPHHVPVPIPIELEGCAACGFIRQNPDRRIELDYSGIRRSTSQQLPYYVDDILAGLRAFGAAKDSLLLEVGANDGSFLKTLRDAGFQRLLGVEPSQELAGRAAGEGFAIECGYFNRGMAAELLQRHGPLPAVVCRHTLEHVPDPAGMVSAIADVLRPGGLCFIEVPDHDWVIANLSAHEIWDEHLYYFRPGNLALMVERAGLIPLHIEPIRFRDTQNLLCWAIKPPARPELPHKLAPNATTLEAITGFQDRWDRHAGQLRAIVASLPRPLIAIGASHIQMNFLNYSALSEHIDILIDDAPDKAGFFAPLQRAVPIATTKDILQDIRGGTILRTAFPYPQWQDHICKSLEAHNVRSVCPYTLTVR